MANERGIQPNPFEGRVPAEDKVGVFFDRPVEEVAADFSAEWEAIADKGEVHDGHAKILVLDTPYGPMSYRVTSVVTYDDDYTMERWKNSRGPQISKMKPGGVVAYSFRGAILPFIKTQDAANIQIARLTNGGETLKSTDVAKAVGLTHNMEARLQTIDLGGHTGFYLSTRGTRPPEGLTVPDLLSPEDLDVIGRDLLK